MITALALAATVPLAGALLFLVLPRMERWLDDSEELTSSRDQVRTSRSSRAD